MSLKNDLFYDFFSPINLSMHLEIERLLLIDFSLRTKYIQMARKRNAEMRAVATTKYTGFVVV